MSEASAGAANLPESPMRAISWESTAFASPDTARWDCPGSGSRILSASTPVQVRPVYFTRPSAGTLSHASTTPPHSVPSA